MIKRPTAEMKRLKEKTPVKCSGYKKETIAPKQLAAIRKLIEKFDKSKKKP